MRTVSRAATGKLAIPAGTTIIILLYFCNNSFSKIIYKLSQESAASDALLYILRDCNIVVSHHFVTK